MRELIETSFWGFPLSVLSHLVYRIIIIIHITLPCLRITSFLHLSHCCLLPLDSPPCLLVTGSPFLLNITQSLLDLVHRVQVAGVFANVVADLDRRTAGRRGDLDDDVERCGLLAGGGVGEVICDGQLWSKLSEDRTTYLSGTSQCQK